MEFEIIIKKDGTAITDILERGSEECSTIKQFTNALGKEIDDEITGPECDNVEEIVS